MSMSSQQPKLLTERKSLLMQGAESRVFEGSFCGREAVFKERFRKRYRLQQLDDNLTKERIRNEARSLCRCQAAGIAVPTLYHADLHGRLLVTARIEGLTLKQLLCEAERAGDFEKIGNLLTQVGHIIAQLHKINVVHGDLTTSNIMYSEKGLVLIDFGLSSTSEKVEEKAVDIYVLERAFSSTHPSLESRFSSIIKSYGDSMGKKSAQAILDKYKEVQLRGRKRTMEG